MSTGFEAAAAAGRSARRRATSAGLERRHLHARRVSEPGGQPAVPAAVGQHGHAPAARPGEAQERLGGVDELARRPHAPDPRGRACGLDRERVAHERARVRAGRAHGRRGVLDREQEHRRARVGRRPGRRGEPAPVAEILGVERDQARRLVQRERAHELRGLQVDLVAERGEPREAEPDRRGAAADLEREVAALGDQADRARAGGRWRRARAPRPRRTRRGSSGRAAARRPRARARRSRRRARRPRRRPARRR